MCQFLPVTFVIGTGLTESSDMLQFTVECMRRIISHYPSIIYTFADRIQYYAIVFCLKYIKASYFYDIMISGSSKLACEGVTRIMNEVHDIINTGVFISQVGLNQKPRHEL